MSLYGFPWALMAWAFEAIPPLRKQVKDYPDEVSHPRILRWLAAKSNTRIKEVDLFNPPNDAVMYPWIMPTEQELGMTSFITLGLINTIADLIVELINKKLAGAISIRRVVRQGQPNVKALHDQPATTNPGAMSEGVAGGVVHIRGNHADVDIASSCDDEHVDAPKK
ncbi:hypothetical protein FXO37_30143 [Capsicum annuum]|nr:hypothetical protein FXO37_30143 [Capsicum annuum]